MQRSSYSSKDKKARLVDSPKDLNVYYTKVDNSIMSKCDSLQTHNSNSFDIMLLNEIKPKTDIVPDIQLMSIPGVTTYSPVTPYIKDGSIERQFQGFCYGARQYQLASRCYMQKWYSKLSQHS